MQKQLEDGRCEYCPLYNKSTQDGKDCERVHCGPNAVNYFDGTCRECEAGTVASEDGRFCKHIAALINTECKSS